ncbi:MAG: T9SS type B sorting domain-containing protein [Bacteroidota bacterium]
MRLSAAASILLFALAPLFLVGQVSEECPTAIPICSNTPINGGTNGYGADDFQGAATSGCLERTVSGAIESNSAWYRFRTGASGQLGFNIGHNTDEDWDFALYQTDNCNNLGTPIRCNFFDNRDENAFIGVGEDPSGALDNTQYETWLDVAPGQDYYLLINNFSASNTGFSIQFSGQIFVDFPNTALDCSIVTNLLGPPIAVCEGDTVILDATTTNATSYVWSENTGSGPVEITGETGPTLQVLQSAWYQVVVTTPGITIFSEVQVGFSPLPVASPVSDVNVCYTEGTLLNLAQKDAEVLGAQNAADFVVTYHITQADAQSGINPLPRPFTIPPTSETLYIRVSSRDQSECFDASQQFDVNVTDVTFPDLEESVTICEDTGGVVIGVPNPSAAFNYLWNTGDTTGNLTVSESGTYTLTISAMAQGVDCSTTREITVTTSVLPQIQDILIEDLSVSNSVTVVPVEAGDFEYSLDDGPFQSSARFEPVLPGAHTITMRDLLGCGTVTASFVVVGYNNYFSPNGDNSNEVWSIEGLSTLSNPVVTIFDRYGKLMVQFNDLDNGWDGNYNGKPMPSDDYWFRLEYNDEQGNRTIAKYLQRHFSLRR